MGTLDLKNHALSQSRAVRRKLGIAPFAPPEALVQEEAGIHVGISPDLVAAARHASAVMAEKYRLWWHSGRFAVWDHYKCYYFTVAVGGGNTLKAQYKIMVNELYDEIDWTNHVRFFFLEESSGEPNWESPEQSLRQNFIVPLAQKLVKTRGVRALAKELKLDSTADLDDIIDRLVTTLVNPINMTDVGLALQAKNRPLALKRAHAEAQRYQTDIEEKLGATMEFHYIISGIGKNGTLGALEPYMRELSKKVPGAMVLKRGPKALRIALNRGVLINGERISLIVSGNLKLRALGRFEMAESADFEQTVMETPLRMLRETYEIAQKVYIFADEKSLHFEETKFKYSEQGNILYNKAETREGEEKNGAHMLLLHGFMGLFSFTNFLVRLPSAWTVSAMHRGSYAKTLENDDIFPHYARVLRQAVLDIWNQGRPVPIAGHSIAGVIIDHLLLSLMDNYDAPITPYEKLRGSNRKLVDALRASGIISLATWAPPDGLHTRQNIKSVACYYRKKEALDYSGFSRVYHRQNEALITTEEATVSQKNNLSTLDRFLQTPIAEPLVGSLNRLMRSLLNNKKVQQKILNANSPYVLRLVGNRLLKTASFYGLCKEINAAMHAPVMYQERHLKALDIILAYDIPYLSIVHEDDFLVSAKRHQEEHNYLITHRRKKEGADKAGAAVVTTRYIKLKRVEEEMPLDPLNPHLMIMGTSSEGNTLARQVTTAMTRFVNENIDRASKGGKMKPLSSVKKWVRKNSPKNKKSKAKVA
ncbi:MAG: 6-phosphogluconolactonase [Halioglobus sp.]|nr:6-phosphogluconolactonase [Halioglobus sp.]